MNGAEYNTQSPESHSIRINFQLHPDLHTVSLTHLV